MADPRDDEREYGEDDTLVPAEDIGLDQLDEDVEADNETDDSDDGEAEDDE